MRNTHLLFILAAILITNSHLKSWYPNPVFGVDGHMGNSIFYAMSGFGAALSLRSKPLGLRSYYRRRISRLYPAVTLGAIVFVLILGGEWNHIPESEGPWTLGKVLSHYLGGDPSSHAGYEGALTPAWLVIHYFTKLIYPSPYLYVTWILLFYFFIWVVARRSVWWPIGAILLAYVPFGYYWLKSSNVDQVFEAGSLPFGFWLSEGFQYAMFGVLLAHFTEHLKKTRFWRETLWALLMMALYFGTKFLLKKSYLPMPAGVLLFFLMYPTIYVLLRWSASADLLAYLNRRPFWAGIVAFLGGLTLEIYITQDYFQYCKPLKNLPFPLRIAALFSAVLVAATALQFASRGVQKFLARRNVAPVLAEKSGG